MKLNERIKACRQRSGLTQEQVAEALDVSRQSVTKWENGQIAPSTEKLFMLAELFGTTVDVLMPREKSDTPQPDQLNRTHNHRNNMVKMVLFTAIWQVLIIACGFTLVVFDVISLM